MKNFKGIRFCLKRLVFVLPTCYLVLQGSGFNVLSSGSLQIKIQGPHGKSKGHVFSKLGLHAGVDHKPRNLKGSKVLKGLSQVFF